MNIFYGVMSKNQVDAIVSFSLAHPEKEITFIPSRRQIEYNGGYVHDWTTATFSTYVKSLNPRIQLERDHGGPGQGLYDDDGYRSLEEDCRYFDTIHIDPWKKYPALEDGIRWTIDMIRYCHERNPALTYEIGTEEAIRPYSASELDAIIQSVQRELTQEQFTKIKYGVIQCGNSLSNGNNSGQFDKSKLRDMLDVVSRHGLIAKEHNGDWVSMDVITEKNRIGLTCLNIAPEFGMIESTCVLEHIKHHAEHYDAIYQVCFDSGKWKKWVTSDFDHSNRYRLMQITCHYLFSHPVFTSIVDTYHIEEARKECIQHKLYELYNSYETHSCAKRRPSFLTE